MCALRSEPIKHKSDSDLVNHRFDAINQMIYWQKKSSIIHIILTLNDENN